MELSLKIELTDRRNSGESRALFNILFCWFFKKFFSTENLGGPGRGPERGPEGDPEGGSRKGGPRFVYTRSFYWFLGSRYYCRLIPKRNISTESSSTADESDGATQVWLWIFPRGFFDHVAVYLIRGFPVWQAPSVLITSWNEDIGESCYGSKTLMIFFK